MNNVTIVEGKCPIFIIKVKDHQLIKDDILNSISSMGKHSMVTKHQSISNSDWYIPRDRERPYLSIIHSVIENHSKILVDILKANNIQLLNVWFQQYEKGDFHTWHTHSSCIFSNVYYVDLDSQNPKTSFRVLGQEIEVDVEEGNIVTFPSFIEHCSKVNQSNNTKTVISFNSNYST
jgi:hypothetical protein